jgi:penicillin-binding protein 1A
VLGSSGQGPVGISEIYCPLVKCRGKRKLIAAPHYRRVMPAPVAAEVHDLLEGVVHDGTGMSANIPGVDMVGKTGTTNNEGDAWFVGWTPQITTAVWVGFPNKLEPMLTQYNGNPVTGGTFPAEIWKSFTEQAIHIETTEQAAHEHGGKTTVTTSSLTTPIDTTPATTATAPVTTPTTGVTATSPSPTTPATTPAPTGTDTTGGGAATTPATGGGGATTPATGGSTTPGNTTGGTGGAGLPGG